MSVDIANRKEQLNGFTHSVRAAQAVLQYGVGAMIDFPDQTLMTAAPEYWAENVMKIHDERLEKALNVDFFGMPGDRDEIKYREGISYARFPEWYFCPKCRKFMKITKWINEYKRKSKVTTQESDPFMIKHMKCFTCNQELVVARIITVCEDGHINDFPWEKWVHRRNISGSRDVCANPLLTFKTGSSASEGLEGLVIKCENCNAKTTLKDAFDPEIFQKMDEKNGRGEFLCEGKHPWKHKKDKCLIYPRSMQRGSSAVYFPVTVSSLVIPPFSDKLNDKIENSCAYQDCLTTLSNIPSKFRIDIINSQIEQWVNKISLEIGVKDILVKSVLDRKWSDNLEESQNTKSVKYRAEEYDALNGSIGIQSFSDGFVREEMSICDYNIFALKNISLIHKIREVRALTGFSRLNPSSSTSIINADEHFVSIKEEKTNWYPAYEVRGEGIFLEFNENAIKTWNSNTPEVTKRVLDINDNYKQSFIGSKIPRLITAKFLLLHTLAHLLIRQLSFECGYNIASLRERIYCGEKVDGKEMAGMLIYTASGDSEGTLGGLVRQGRSDSFPRIFNKAIETAISCSNDPVCILSHGQGRDSLNLAACHTCTLIPETSCEEFNVLLDRGIVVGTFEKKSIGFYSNKLYGTNQHWNIIDECKLTNAQGANQQSVSKKTMLLYQQGVDLSGMPYLDIWKYLKEDTITIEEKNIIEEVINKYGHIEMCEKPQYNGILRIIENNNEVISNFIWEKKKIALFLSENVESYQKTFNSDWKCFCTSNIDSLQVLIDLLIEV